MSKEILVSLLSPFSVLVGFCLTIRSMDRRAKNAEVTNYHNIIQFQKDTWLQFFLGDSTDGARMLAWHLEARGIEDMGYIENKKVLFILLRFDVYEEMLLAQEKKILTKTQIIGWDNAIKRDFDTDEFCRVWEKVSKYYHPALNQYHHPLT